ncbi:hypothetical protein D3C81_1120030 [compost metagenome]
MTLEDMETDYWAHHFFEDPKAAEEVEDDEFDIEAELAKLENNPDDWEALT